MNERDFSIIVIVFCALFIAGFAYYLSLPHPSISVVITGPAEVQLGDPFTCNMTVTNTGNRDLFNVSVTDSYGFGWNGSLAVRENRTFFIEFNGSTGEDVVNEVRVEGYTEEGAHVRDQASWTVFMIRPLARYDLLSAIDEELIDVEFRGTGNCSGPVIKLKITNNLNVSIEIKTTPGLILINTGSGQNMITADGGTFLYIAPQTEIDFDIEGYCLDLHKDNPSSKETFSTQTDSGTYGEDVVRLMESLEGIPSSQKSIEAVQIALWVITDDISEGDLRIDYSTGDIEDAEWLLENAGIDTAGKKLFQKG